MLKAAMPYSHDLLAEIVVPGDTVVDATVGNGHDTEFLATLVGSSGKVIGFDVQETAIAHTTQRLAEKNLLSQTTLYQQGHETLEDILSTNETVKAAIFNLGYLPKSDKSIITTGKTTTKALDTLLECLEKAGRIILVVYYGHEGGVAEKEAVLNYVKKIPQEDFNVLSYQFINQKNSPPILICIEKKHSKHAR